MEGLNLAGTQTTLVFGCCIELMIDAKWMIYYASKILDFEIQ